MKANGITEKIYFITFLLRYFASIGVSAVAMNTNGIAKGPRNTTINLRAKLDFTFLIFAM